MPIPTPTSCSAVSHARIFLFALLLVAPATMRAAVNFPFASHPMPYAAGTITPNHLSQAILDQAVRDFYDAWKERYVSEECGTGRFVVLAQTSSGNLTVSEAHGYGMMLTALMAGHDPDARRVFDGMYAHFRGHPSVFTPDLMAWNQNKSCADVEGGDSASDGDLDIAYALLLADKQWGSCGPIDYLAEALDVIAAIKTAELDSSALYVKLGDWATPASVPYYDSTRSSDFMPDHHRSFLAATTDATWTALLDRTYQIVSSLQTNHSPTTGLLPDFVVSPLVSPAPAPADFLEGPLDGAYSYNACRDPWRLATDFVVSGDARAGSAAQMINTWIRTSTGNDPNGIKSGYALDGTFGPDADFLSMAFVAPLGAGAMVDASNQTWLNSIWDLVNATPLGAEGYYENTLKLLSMIVMSGNWWAPQALVAPACVPDSTPLCTSGGYMSEIKATISGTTKPVGEQGFVWKGKLFFPQGTPVASLDGGAQVLVEDLGAGSSAIFELSTFTDPVPSATDTACDPSVDGWDVGPTRVLYKNKSTAIDTPTCTAGSARGLKKIKYRADSGSDVGFKLKAKPSAIGTPVGPLRFTYVLGNTVAAGTSGACAVSSPVTCRIASSSTKCP